MKKQITMFLAVAMAAGMMAGCSGGKAQTNTSDTAAVSDTSAPETDSGGHRHGRAGIGFVRCRGAGTDRGKHRGVGSGGAGTGGDSGCSGGQPEERL